MKISIICSTRDVSADRANLLFRDIKQLTVHSPYEIIVLDNNNSPDFNHPREHNRGIKITDGDILLLDDDIRLVQGWLSILYNLAYSDSKIGIVVAPTIREEAIENSGGFFDIENFGIRMSRDAIKEPRFAHWGCSACMYVKRELIDRIGLLDEQFTKFAFDLDYSIRCWQAGYKLIYSSSFVFHESVTSWLPESASLGQKDNALLRNKWQDKLRDIYANF